LDLADAAPANATNDNKPDATPAWVIVIARPSKNHPHPAKSDCEDDYNYYDSGCLFPVHVTSQSCAATLSSAKRVS